MDRRWILGGVLFAGGIGVVRALTYRPKFDENSRVLLIGDSFANGMAPHLQSLASDEELPFVGGALNGTHVAQWANSEWLLRKLIEFEPTHVIISLGTNDAYANIEPQDVQEDTEILVSLIEESDAHPIWVGAPALPPVYNGNSVDLDTIVAIREAVPYYFDSGDLEIPRGPDVLHPTAAGYAGWAGTLWNWLT